MPLKNHQELTLGFVRDQIDQDEFYLEIQSKMKNPKTGERDVFRLAVDDIDEFEHVEGTLQFYIHYRASTQQQEAGTSITGFLKRKIKKETKKIAEKEEKSELLNQSL